MTGDDRLVSGVGGFPRAAGAGDGLSARGAVIVLAIHRPVWDGPSTVYDPLGARRRAQGG